MPTAALEALSDAARSFIESGPHKLLIGADWVDPADGRSFETIDPATGEPICEVAQAGAEDVERAAAAARAALEGPWGQMPAAGRSQLMNPLADLVEEHIDELAELESLDNGKPLKMARVVDLPRVVAHLRYYAGWPTKIEGETIPSPSRTCSPTRSRSRWASAADHPLELPAADGLVEDLAGAGRGLHRS